MSAKLHFLRSHLNYFPKNCKDLSECKVSAFNKTFTLFLFFLLIDIRSGLLPGIRGIISKVKLATLIKGDPKSPFSIATTPSCRGGHYPIPRIAPLYS